MKFTNKQNLPELYVRVVTFDDHIKSGADIGATTLLRPPRAVALSKVYGSKIVEDVADRHWAFFGEMAHLAMERADVGDPNEIIERMYYADIEGWTVATKPDLFQIKQKTLTDSKFVSSYSVKAHRDGENSEWSDQLDIMTWVLRENGLEVENVELLTMSRDWSKMEALRNRDYPRSAIIPLRRKARPQDKCEALVRRLVLKHQAAQKCKTQDEMPLCTDEERWKKPDKWAVMKKGRKSALRVLESREKALWWCRDNGHAVKDEDIPGGHALATGISIVHRKGEPTRCRAYCSVSDFCTQYQQELSAEGS